jgi:hypothetical protein
MTLFAGLKAYAAEIKLIAILVILLGVAGASGYAVWKYEDMSKTIQQNAQVQQTMKKANDDQAAQIKQDKSDLQQQQIDYGQLQTRLDANAAQLSALQRKFSTTNAAVGTQSLGTVAAVKPQIVQDMINRGTNDAFECLEIVTGAKLNETPTTCDQPNPTTLSLRPSSASSSGK